MRWSSITSARLLTCVCLAAILSPLLLTHSATLPKSKPRLERQNAKRWKKLGDRIKREAASKSQEFLTKRGLDLSVPIVIDVLTLGFNGDGGYKVKLQLAKLEEMLQGTFNRYCPSVWDTKEQSGLCYYVTYNVIDLAQHGQDIRDLEKALATRMERTVNADDTPGENNATEHGHGADPHGHGADPHGHEHKGHFHQEVQYEVEAMEVEHWFQTAWHKVFGNDDDTASKHWHKHNAIFIVNPSKLRMDPRLNGTAPKEDVNPVDEWQKGNLSLDYLLQQDGGYTYQYQYYGEGATCSWLSSHQYAVIDLAAGPCEYGPSASPLTPSTHKPALPNLMEILDRMLEEAREVHQLTAREGAVQKAVTGHQTALLGELMAPIVGAAQHVFMPDLATEHIEYARRILVPIIVLSDHDDVDPLETPTEANIPYYLNLDEVDHAARQLIGPDQKIVFASSSFYIHHHPNILAAVQKAMHSEAEVHWDSWEHDEGGLHSQLSSYLDGPTLLDELSMSGDILSEGLFEHESMEEQMQWEGDHELRHSGTRTVPIFVLSLKHTPENLLFRDKSLVAANKDAVVVLQLLDPHDEEGFYTGGVFTGHEMNGKHVVVDAHNPTRHVIAGLATALAGIVPPYQRYDPIHDKFTYDWLWAVGATPYGPYTHYPGVSALTAAIAQRNILFSHAEGALRRAQASQQKLDGFVAGHLQSPLQPLGTDGSTHYLEVLHDPAHDFGKLHGFNTSITPDIANQLDTLLDKVDTQLTSLMITLYDHKFRDAPSHIAQLHHEVDNFQSKVDVVVDEGESLLTCCNIHHQAESILTYGGMLGAAIAFVLIAALMAAIVLSRPPARPSYRRTSRGILG